MGGFVLILLGLILAIVFNVFKRVPNQKTTIGTVVSCKYKLGPNHFEGVIEYEVGMKAYHIKKGYNCHPVGNKEKVAYNAENPEDAFIVPTFGVYVLVIALIMLGFDVVFAEFIPGYELIFNIWGL